VETFALEAEAEGGDMEVVVTNDGRQKRRHRSRRWGVRTRLGKPGCGRARRGYHNRHQAYTRYARWLLGG
jgi:hypothetical protein